MPIITISRGMFSGGLAIANKVADQLGYPCIGKSRLYEAIKELGLSEQLYRSIFSGSSNSLNSPAKRIGILNMFRAGMLGCIQDGNLVYHGTVGHLLLSNISNILKVRVNASMDKRIQTAIQTHELNHDQAVALIRKADQESELSARNIYDVDWCDPLLYDIVLNCNNISIDNAAEILIRMAAFENFQPSPTPVREYNDLVLSCRVWAQLHKDPDISGTDVMVTANDGHITVHGHVTSDEAAQKIPGVASAVEGVQRVHCNVTIGSIWLG